MNDAFHSPTRGRLTFDDLIAELVAFLRPEPSSTKSVFIGTDSEERSDHTEYMNAVVLYHQGRGGRYFVRRHELELKATMRERIWQETVLSIELGKAVVDALAIHGAVGTIEIHCDVGERGRTSELIREITGYVRANGFTVRTKPNSCAASSVADRQL